MKKLPLIITTSIVALCVGGYFLYSQFLVRKSVSAWDLVPGSSVLVYEAGTCSDCDESVKQSSVWSIIQKASFYAKPSDSLNTIYNFLTSAHHSLVSLHVTKKDDFDFIFYSRIDQKKFSIVLDQWKRNKNLKYSTRELSATKIEELSFNKRTFSWVFVGDIWIGSFTPFLIEDVIRTYDAGNDVNFKNRISDVYQLPSTKKDAGNLYIHLRNLPSFLSVFMESSPASLIQEFGKSAILDIQADGKKIVFNGFSSDSSNQDHYVLSIFSNQNPVPFNTKKLISNRTVMLTSYGISDGVGFKNNLLKYEKRSTYLRDTLSVFSKTLKFDVDNLFRNINGELGVCFVESKGQDIAKVLLVETRHSKVMLDALNDMSSQLSTDTVFYEKFSDYEIRELPLFRFPEKLFWPLVSGFDKTYYTSLGNTVIIADNLEELKKYLDDIDREDTWGKSVSQNKYLESTLLESTISLYINTPRIWNVLSGAVNPTWKKFIGENKNSLQSLGMGAIQFSHLSESFYTNVTWSYSTAENETGKTESNQRTITNLGSPIGKVFLFKSHVDKSNEALAQDSSFNLHLLSNEGKVLWKIALDDMIMGNVEQIDYFNNGKLQFFFITKNKIHIIDRLGNYVKPFPVVTSVSDLEYSSVVDYDHSRKYRFLLASKSGKLWMYDKEGKNLEGWQPKIVEEGLALAPRHHRIRGKDYILAICKNGKVYVMNRRGDNLKNFPLDIDARLSGEYFLELGNDRAHTYFVVISKDGYRIKFNLDGKVQSRETLVKTIATTQFSLITEMKGASYLILRQDAKQLVMMDDESKPILTNDFIGLDPVVIQYADFGSGNIYIVVTDQRQGLSFLYDAKGNLLTTPPLESYIAIPVLSDTDKPILFTAYQNALRIQPFP